MKSGSLRGLLSQKPRIISRSQVSDRSEFSLRFAQVQEDLRQDPYRIGMPGIALGQRFAELSLPIESEFWIAEGSSLSDRGRIVANLSPYYKGFGYLGFFEADCFETAQQLLETGLEWLKARRVERVFGPLNFNTWLSYRFRINPDDQSPNFGFEPVQPPNYPLWWKELGFQIIERYHSDGLDGIEQMVEGTRADYESALAQGFTFRKWDPLHSDREAKILYEISMQAFQKNFLFESVPFEFFQRLYVPSAAKFDFSLAYFVSNPEGKEIGLFFNFIDSDYFVLKTTALLPEARGLRLSNALLHPSAKEAHERGIRRSIAALMRDGIQSESYSKRQTRIWSHEYGLFGTHLI